MSDNKKPSIARGADLTADTWADFVARLHYDCIGAGVARHYTADAVFLVEKRVWQAVPDELSDICRIYSDGCDETPDEFFYGLETEAQATLNDAADGSFMQADGYNKREALEKLYPDSTLYYAQERWEFVNQHMTRDAADAFIKRKAHDYRDGLRVYVDASSYSWELNTIKAAIIEGRIGLLSTKEQS